MPSLVSSRRERMLSSADPTTRSLDLELDPSPQVSSRSFFALSALSPKGDIAIDSFQIHRLREMQRMKKPPRRKLAVSLEDWLLFLEANTPISFSRT
jgi:hypothetical protein